mmetsp:Transcript_34920/g.35102  ORF Transcript_34920/g.35102 Transcript_34920/m.35102 type:complete len:84 (+) Transcript_34920:58-309(+)
MTRNGIDKENKRVALILETRRSFLKKHQCLPKNVYLCGWCLLTPCNLEPYSKASDMNPPETQTHSYHGITLMATPEGGFPTNL